VVRRRIVKRPRILTPGPATQTFLWIRGRFLGRQAVGSLSSIYQYGLPVAADSPRRRVLTANRCLRPLPAAQLYTGPAAQLQWRWA